MIVSHVVYDGVTLSHYSDEELISKGVPVEVVHKACSEQLGALIDVAAGNARAAFVSPGSLVEQEYQLAKQEARDWLTGGKDESEIPTSVSDHMAMFGVDAEAAATEIVATAEQWEQALTTIRSARLGGKSSVLSADTTDAKEQAATAAIAQLDDIRPPEGSL